MNKKLLVGSIAASSVFALTGCRFPGLNAISGFTYKNAGNYSVASEFNYSTSGLLEVDLDWISGDVEVIQKEGSELKVIENSEDLKDDQKMHYLLDGNILRIKYCVSGYVGRIDRKA